MSMLIIDGCHFLLILFDNLFQFLFFSGFEAIAERYDQRLQFEYFFFFFIQNVKWALFRWETQKYPWFQFVIDWMQNIKWNNKMNLIRCTVQIGYLLNSKVHEIEYIQNKLVLDIFLPIDKFIRFQFSWSREKWFELIFESWILYFICTKEFQTSDMK